ncbi:MAG TPA: LLM class flavin-dependent oxidoreductase [Alphaproteobacteria bacterium]|nr:LLM class flavin-dependent oxidoreductase [Alphaproteobacteria bacterium]
MTEMAHRQGEARPEFGLPSDRGGKDFGVFLPMANGGWILSTNSPIREASWDYNRKTAILAEEIGLDFIMSMAKWRGYGGVTQQWRYALDSQMLMAALATVTKRVRIVTTVHTLLQNPAVTAKMIATLDHISNGRAGLNIVTGAYKGEFEQMQAWRENVGHDERYDLADEWITIIKRLWTEDSVTFHGKYFTMEDCQSDPKPIRPPFLVCAGTSTRGMRFTADQVDVMFCTGKDHDEMAQVSTDMKAMARKAGRSIKTYTMLNLVIGETEAAAQAEAELYRDGFDWEACKGMMRAYGFLDSEIGKENAFVAKARSGFMSAHLIGSAENITRQLIDLLDKTQLDGMMLIFPDYLKGMPVFAREVLPHIRARFPERAGLAHAG